VAKECGIELERNDLQIGRREALEQLLRVERSIETSNAGVIPSDDEMRDTVVLSHQRVEDGFARSRVAHRGRKRGEQRSIAWIVLLDQQSQFDISVRTQSVRTNDSTRFENIACTGLRNGVAIEVKGVAQPDRSVLAARIEPER